MSIDPFRLSVAVLPLAVYCLLLGLIHLMRRPLLTTGARDLAALGVAISGLVVVGPMELLMPEAAAMRFGEYVWVFLLSFYGLCVALLVLLSRPRLVIYNLSIEQLRPVLAEVVAAIDPGARWAGDSLVLPRLGVQLHLDYFPAMRHVTLVANGPRQNFEGWQRLEVALSDALVDTRVPSNPRALSLVTLSLVLLVACLTYMLGQPQAVAQGFQELLRK